MNTLSTQELISKLEKTNAILIDVRPIAAYNGWALQNEQRGGHIPGAKSIPMQWTQYMDWVEVLEEKSISRDQPVVVYGYDENQSNEMYTKLIDLGYSDVEIYTNFVEEWAGNSDLPLNQLPRYKHLVYPEWIKNLIDGQQPPHFNNDDYVICHSHYDHIEDYHKGHIPGAIPVDTNSLESTETWNRRLPEELQETLQKLGIRHDTTVVIYGRFSSPVYNEEKFPGKSAGHLGALRCAAIMLYAGVEDIRILNGGITSWETRGYDLTTEEHHPTPVEDFGKEIPGNPEYMIDTPEAKQLLASNKGELVSIRSWEEFIGNRSGYHYIEKKGRIPGAIFGNCGSDAYHMENYRNFDHTMREYQEIASAWKEGGITPDKHVAFYCGTGWRGSEAFMNAWLMGWPKVSVYDGGWFEWCNDPENPIETGEPDQSVLKNV
ncbi:thiosulfate sulfurtransferase [Aliifodinibius salipaludis]|uniref:Sulfurtransferase n=1 Tax=Fodinibius salipaludis TaxID=2032627 RepID=A0A2A2GB31_9BACT|nr:rhodanese-like domain-containing protein [Aliifodinibius salipaludis]PAU94771.1 thiosulfate sulfurtransferase [Aliifodinibius salipaludis]